MPKTKTKYHLWLFLLACSFFLTGGFAQNPVDTLKISETNPEFAAKKIYLAPYLYVLTDSVGTWTLEDIISEELQKKFYRDTQHLLYTWDIDLGSDVKAVWAKITIDSQLEFPLSWLINISAGDVSFYIPTISGSYDHKRSGLALPIKDRYYQRSYGYLPCFPLEIAPGSSQTLYFKLSKFPIVLGNEPAHLVFNQFLFAPEVYSGFDAQYRFLKALFLGMMIAVAFYHLMIYLFNRKSVFLFFSLFVFVEAMALIMGSGHATEFLLPNREKFVSGIIILFTNQILWALFIYLFSRQYLQLKKLFPVGDKIWLVLVIVSSIVKIGILSIVFSSDDLINSDWYDWAVHHKINMSLKVLLYIIAIVAPVVSFIKGNKQAGIYFLAMAILIYQRFVKTINFNTSLNLPSIEPPDLGKVIAILLFAFGIARVIKLLEDEKMTAEKSQTKLKAESERMKALDEFKTKFYTNITHEFRTPLTIILGMADHMKNKPEEWYHEGLRDDKNLESNSKK